MSVLAGGITVAAVGEAVGLVVVIIAVAVIVVAYFRASYAKATIETLKESNAALTERVELLEGDNERCSKELSAIRSENSSLRTLVSGAAAITEMQTTMTQHFREVNMQLTDLKGLLRDRRQTS